MKLKNVEEWINGVVGVSRQHQGIFSRQGGDEGGNGGSNELLHEGEGDEEEEVQAEE